MILLALLLQTQVSRVEISPANAEIQIGQSVRLTARALDAQGKEIPGVKLSWFSGGGEGSVDSTGLVTAGYTGYVRVTAVAPVPATASGDDMGPGEVLPPGLSIRSPNGRHALVYQGDGNLVLNGPAGPAWASNTAGRSVGAAVMRDDGNLVVQDASTAAVWTSGTGDHPGSRLVVQDDGNVVIYRPDGAAVWATDTAQP